MLFQIKTCCFEMKDILFFLCKLITKETLDHWLGNLTFQCKLYCFKRNWCDEFKSKKTGIYLWSPHPMENRKINYTASNILLCYFTFRTDLNWKIIPRQIEKWKEWYLHVPPDLFPKFHMQRETGNKLKLIERRFSSYEIQ